MHGQSTASGILPELHVYTGYLFGPDRIAKKFTALKFHVQIPGYCS
jgi:hypothetical protein